MIDARVLANFSAFDNFDERARAAVGALMVPHMVADGEVLLPAGSRHGGAFLVIDGVVRVLRQVAGGRMVLVRTCMPGTMFGLRSSIEGGARVHTYQARGRCQLAELPRSAFEELLSGRTSLALGFQLGVCRELFRQVRETNVRVAELAAAETELSTGEVSVAELHATPSLDDLSELLQPLPDA